MKSISMFWLLFSVLLLSPMLLKAGEMKFLWSHSFQDGFLWDMKLMPDNDYFVLGYDDRIELRETETGNLVKVDSIIARNIEVSSDSTKLYVNCINSFQVRDVNTFEVLKSVTLPDTIDGYRAYYSDFCADPARPLIYFKRALQYGEDNRGNALVWQYICVYNAETLEFITQLSSEEQKMMNFTKMDVSADGKYLAAINTGKSILLVWDLETREQIINHYMAPETSTQYGEPGDLKFSRVNTDNIYINGSFKHGVNDKDHMGVSIYNISQQQIIDERFNIEDNQTGVGKFSFLSNEEYLLSTVSYFTEILDLKNNIILYKSLHNSSNSWGISHIYSDNDSIIIGHGSSSFSAGYYDFESSVEDTNNDDVIYPNPTTNEINIPFTCTSHESIISIFDINGNDLTSQIQWQYTGEMYTIDLSGVTVGVYVVRINCGESSSDYRVVREK